MKKILLLAFFSLLILSGGTQVGVLDSSFGTNGFVKLPVNYDAAAFQSDGKLIGVQKITGGFTITRYNTNGAVDATFRSGGVATVIIPNMGVPAAVLVAVQPVNNNIIVEEDGTSTLTTNAKALVVCRIKSGGYVDSTFGINGISTGTSLPNVIPYIKFLLVQNNGTIITGLKYVASIELNVVDFYDSNGTRTPGYSGPPMTALAVGGSGQIAEGVAVPNSSPPYDTTYDIFCIKYSLIFGKTSYPPYSSLAVQGDDKVLAVRGSTISRFNIDGSFDATFGKNGSTDIGFTINKILVLPDGKIAIGGTYNNNFAVALLNANGAFNTTFGSGGKTVSDFGGNDTIVNMEATSKRLYAWGTNILAAYTLAQNCTPLTFKNDGTIVADASCANNDGSINIIPTSGTAPFTYSINGGTTYVAGPDNGYSFTRLAAGTYKLRLKDAAGCESETVEKVVRLNCASNCLPPTFVNNSLIILDATCANNDGNINIIPTSGTAPFKYSINGGTTYVNGADAGYGFQNLPSGAYKLRLKDATGCESAIVERQVRLICTATCTPPTFVNNGLIVLDASCANNDGNINIIPTSGTAPFMYSINGGVTYVAGPNAGYGFQNLPSGTYFLRLKDARGCESAIVEKQVRLLCASACTPPTFVNNGLIVLDASCGKSDGSVSIIPTSGIAPFMYSINGGATYVAGPNAGYGFQNLPAGTYQLRLKDSRGCESAIVAKTVRNYYNCAGVTVSTNTSEASLVLSNKDVLATYPNPNSGQFKLLLQNFTSPKAEVSIYDAKGTLIQKRSLNITQNTIADFDLKGKAAGLYLIKVVTASGIKNMKVIVQ
jgi:uncharacterized delta-60 repeat protein